MELATRDQVAAVTGRTSRKTCACKVAEKDVCGHFLSAKCATTRWSIQAVATNSDMRAASSVPGHTKGAAVALCCCHAEVAAARGGRNRACRLFTLAARLLTHIGSSRRGPSFLQLPAAATTGSTGSAAAAAAAPPPATDDARAVFCALLHALRALVEMNTGKRVASLCANSRLGRHSIPRWKPLFAHRLWPRIAPGCRVVSTRPSIRCLVNRV